MNCSFTELRNKEVINAKTGCRLGCVSDVEIDTCSGCIVSIIIWGKGKCFGLISKDDDIKICWKDIEVIGDDTILVCCVEAFSCCCNGSRKRNFFDMLFKQQIFT